MFKRQLNEIFKIIRVCTITTGKICNIINIEVDKFVNNTLMR